MHDIYSSGHHLLSLINDILGLSKVEARRMELDVSSFNLQALLDNCTTLVRERAMRQGLALSLDVDETLGEWTADQRTQAQAGGHLHQGVGLRKRLQSCRDVWRLAHGQCLSPVSAAHFAGDDKTRVNADAHGELEGMFDVSLLGNAIDPVNDLQSRPDRTLRVVFVCEWIAEIRQYAISQVLRDLPIEFRVRRRSRLDRPAAVRACLLDPVVPKGKWRRPGRKTSR
ncbi:hypothetical protein WKW80_24075 [Variovorax humicola]|uniref:Uncharacterized protein n=1 Tax=Variovorax humicola TaxID=1769758 RepID=A0ABU8W4Z5_9BURK